MRHLTRVGVPLIVMAAVGWYLLSTVNVGQLWSILDRTSWWLLAASIPIILLSHVLRAERWITLLHSDATPRFFKLFNGIMIGYAASTIIPRSGEVIRPLVVSLQSRMGFSVLMASVMVERVLDVLTLLFAVGLILVVYPEALHMVIPGATTTTIIVTFAVPALVLTVLLLATVFIDLERHLGGVLQRIHPALARFAIKVFHSIREGAKVLTSPREWIHVGISSILMWTLYALPLYLVLEAMPWTHEMHFTLLDGFLLLVITATGVTVAPTPGAVGVYQGFAQVAMVSLYGTTPTEGLAFGMVAWLLNYGVALVVGGVCLVVELNGGLSWKQLTRGSSESQPSPEPEA